MKKEIQDLINQHLPELAAGELKKYIEQNEGLADQLKDAKQVIGNQEKELAAYKKRADEFDNLSKWQDALDLREKEVEARERQFELELLKAAKESMFENMKNMERLVDKVFGHPNVQITRSREERYTDQYGNRNSDYNSDDETRRESKT